MKKLIYPSIIIVLLALLFVAVTQCRRNATVAVQNYGALTDTIDYYFNSLGQRTASIRTLQFDKSQLKDIILEKDKELQALSKEFSRISSAVKFRTVTEFDTIRIAYADNVPCIFDRNGSIANDWYKFNYRSDQTGIQIDSFKTWTSANIITGAKRKWFLGKETLKTDITLSNPHMAVTNAAAIEVTIPSPWYRKWYVWVAIGAVGGFVIAK
ncbi:DUF6549 family protein [Flavobacterium sp.]|uniref:DUF6549 family protein n=1 Tax=Flavobacterium sp. TaxID=239 RepID=UPI0040343684